MKAKHFFSLGLLALLCAVLLNSCVKEDTYADNPQGNFEALWHIIDEHYCFLTIKQQEYGLDWNEVHARYQRQINAQMTEAQLFEVLGNMLAELRDGHVNLYSSFDVARNWSWHENYPVNMYDTLITRYLGRNFRIASGLRYCLLDDNVGYLRCATFNQALGEGNLDQIFSYFLPARGLIIDVRSNPGGLISSAEQLAARFTNEPLLVGYMQHKTGRRHDDFSALQEQWLKPSRGIRWQKPVVILTNRGVYSAANEFVKCMKCCPKVHVIGDKTGGGSGLPFSSELPNGWSIRFSACPVFDKDKRTTEFGIMPDTQIGLQLSDFLSGRDTLIEYARTLFE